MRIGFIAAIALLALVAIGCEKTIHEVRGPQNPPADRQAMLADAGRSAR